MHEHVRSGRDRVTSAEPLRKCLLVTFRMSRAARYRASRRTIISLSYYACGLRIECLKLWGLADRVYKYSVFAIARHMNILASFNRLPSRCALIPLRCMLRSSTITTLSKIMRCNKDENVARRRSKHLRAWGPIVINTLPENTFLPHLRRIKWIITDNYYRVKYDRKGQTRGEARDSRQLFLMRAF